MGGLPSSVLAVLGAQLACFEACLLVASALHKLSNWQRSRLAVLRFAGVPASVSQSALAAVVAAELCAAVLLIVPGGRMPGALLATALWGCYLALIVRAVAGNRREVDCGCSFGAAVHPLGTFHWVRNAVLSVGSLAVAGLSAACGDAPVQGSQWLGGLALLVAYFALDQVMVLQPLRGGEAL